MNQTPVCVKSDDRVITDIQKSVVQNKDYCEETIEEKSRTFVNSDSDESDKCSDYAAIQLNEKQTVSEEEMQTGVTRTIDFNQQQDGKPVSA